MIETMQRCGSCRRHVLAAESRCPFCAEHLGLVGAWPAAVIAVALAGATAGCADRNVAQDDGDGSTSAGDASTGTNSASTSIGTTPEPVTTANEVGPGTFDSGDLDTSSEADATATSAGFIYGAPDAGGSVNECDVWAQDCPRGEKCMPWADDGGASWNATRCSPVARDPAAPGEACTVEGSGVSGIDDCALGAMCWDVDLDTLMGECVAQCSGSEAAPVCAGDDACLISNEGVLNLCLPTCDPLAPVCDAGLVCAPIGDVFFCVPDDSEGGGHGDDCSAFNTCVLGLFCANGSLVSGCATQACCTEYCDIMLPAAGQCSGFADGEDCTPWFEMGEAPEGLENLGACVLPQ